MFRFYNNRRQPAPYDVGGTDKFGNYAVLGNIINQFAGNYTRAISNSLVNEFVLGLNKRADPRIDQNYTLDPTTLVNFLRRQSREPRTTLEALRLVANTQDAITAVRGRIQIL